jgi:hypothetical protein
MKIKVFIYNFALFLTFCGCRNQENLIVSGFVVDKITGKPVANAEVLIICRYENGIDETEYSKKRLLTDSKGVFHARFEKGFQIDIASGKIGYGPVGIRNRLSSNKLNFRLELSKLAESSVVTTSLDSGKSEGMRYLYVKYSLDKDLTITKIQTFGLDFRSMTVKSDTSQCDIWFKIPNYKSSFYTIQCSKRGGLVPIFWKDLQCSPLFGHSDALFGKYRRDLRITDEVAGFYVLCRDGRTLGKAILSNEKKEVGILGLGSGNIKHFGRSFLCLYQPNGSDDFSLVRKKIDLEWFLRNFVPVERQ